MVQASQTFVANSINKIPIESPKKLAAINVAAYLAGAAISASSSNLLAVTAFGALAYGTFQGAKIIWLNEGTIDAKKIRHAAFMALSFTAGSSAGSILFKSQLIHTLFTKAIATQNPFFGLCGTKELAWGIAFSLPLAQMLNKFWAASGQSLYQMGTSHEKVYDDSPEVRKIVLTDPLFNLNMIEPTLKVYKFIHDVFFKELDIDTKEWAKQLFNKFLAKSTDEEFKGFIEARIFTDQVQIKDCYLGNETRFLNYYNTVMTSKAGEISEFCQNLQTKIDAIDDIASLERVQLELAEHTRTALNLRKILSKYSTVQADQKNLLANLNKDYQEYLINDDSNDFRKQLRTKCDSKEEETDVLSVLVDIFREADCQIYVKTLELEDQQGKAYTQIFNEELERLGISDFKKLQEAGFDPMPKTAEEKKKLLIDVVRRARGNQTALEQIKDFVQGITPGSNLSQASFIRKTISVAKKVFFEISMLSAKVISVLYTPRLAVIGMVQGGMHPIQVFDNLDEIAPNRDTFARCTTLQQHAWQFATGLTIHGSGFYQGYKLGALAKKAFEKIKVISD